MPEPSSGQHPQGFIMAPRGDDGLELIRANPNAFILLYVIAMRARWSSYLNRYGLEPGEALIGDHENYAMSNRQYRTAKQVLAKFNFATFKATRKGTVARLINTSVFDINIGQTDTLNDRRPTNSRQTADRQPTTNEQGNKEIREEGNREVAALPTAKRFIVPSLEELKLAGAKCGLPFSEVEDFRDYYESNGWRVGRNPMKSWLHALARWKRNLGKNQYANNKVTARPVADRNQGTTNSKRIGQYDGVGRVV